MAAFAAAAQKALADPAVKGLLVASAKADFIAGGDLDMLLKATDAQAMSDNLRQWHKLFRTLETTGKPVAAALNGTTLGGGLELALACHYRVAADNPKARFGFPEVTLGLLPGAGGTPARAAPDGHPGGAAVPHRRQAHQGRRGAKAGPDPRRRSGRHGARGRARLAASKRRRRAARPCSPGTRRATGSPAAAS
jgi:hypothetical protein